MAANLIGQLSDAIFARLQTVMPPSVWHYALVPVPLSVKEWMSLNANTPLLALGLREFKTKPERSGRIAAGTLTYQLTMAVKNERGGGDRFNGDARGPGLYPATEMAIRQINGATFPDLGTVFVETVSQSYAEGFDDRHVVLAVFDLTVFVTFGGEPAGDEIDDFLRVQAGWTPTPMDGAVPGAPVPQDILNQRP